MKAFGVQTVPLFGVNTKQDAMDTTVYHTVAVEQPYWKTFTCLDSSVF